MNDKLRIQEALRVYGSEGVERDTLPRDFYICTDKYNIWGDYKQIPKCPRLNILRKPLFYFPIECPEEWLQETIQNSNFVVMSRGASNPLGFCSRINIFGSLEEAIKKIESLKSNLKPVGHYGTHALYLGKN